MAKLDVFEMNMAELPSIQYTAGTLERVHPDSGDLIKTKGFFTQAGLFDNVDNALQAAGVQKITLTHTGEDGGSKEVEHWFFSELNVAPISRGVPAPTTAGCLAAKNAQRTADSGVVVRWDKVGFEGKPAKSAVAIPCFLIPMLEQGDTQVFYIRLRGTMTDKILNALMQHQMFVLAANKLSGNKKAMYDYVWSLKPAKKPETVGKGVNVKQMYPPEFNGVVELKTLTENDIDQRTVKFDLDDAVSAVWTGLEKESRDAIASRNQQSVVDTNEVLETVSGYTYNIREAVSKSSGSAYMSFTIEDGDKDWNCVCFTPDLFPTIKGIGNIPRHVTVQGKVSVNKYGKSLIVQNVVEVGDVRWEPDEDEIPF